MTVLNDKQIAKLCTNENPMVSPFEPTSIKIIDDKKVISYGSSSFGYDIRVGRNFKRQKLAEGHTFVNPKDPSSCAWYEENDLDYIIIEGGEHIMGISVEKFDLPNNVIGIPIGKSTYARYGILADITALEPGWKGYLTIAIDNLGKLPVMIYANEGIAQIVFHMGEDVDVSYADRGGKYQDSVGIVAGKV